MFIWRATRVELARCKGETEDLAQPTSADKRNGQALHVCGEGAQCAREVAAHSRTAAHEMLGFWRRRAIKVKSLLQTQRLQETCANNMRQRPRLLNWVQGLRKQTAKSGRAHCPQR